MNDEIEESISDLSSDIDAGKAMPDSLKEGGRDMNDGDVNNRPKNDSDEYCCVPEEDRFPD